MSRPHNGDDVFRAVAHPVRRRIIDLLAQKDRTVAELVECFEISRASLSRHLNVLRTAALVSQRRAGKTWKCSLRPATLRMVSTWSCRAVGDQ